MTPKYIALHHSLTQDSGAVSWNAIRNYHTKVKNPPWDDIGYHYGLELIGDHYEILMGRMPDIKGAHCIGLNGMSLGVVFVGDFTSKCPPLKQWQLGVKLVKYLTSIYNIPTKNVIGHREWDLSRTCPGRMFDLAQFRAEL
jgi:hypothetical protein